MRPGVESGHWIGAVVGVFDRGRLETFSYGCASRSGPLVNGRSLFEIGSITKTYTAALLEGLAGGRGRPDRFRCATTCRQV